MFFLVTVLFYSPVCWYMTPFFRTPGVLDVGKNTLYVQVWEKERTLEEIISELREKLDEIERR
ncbi:MAG: hypothetical protein K2K54_05700 [Lachnospiraceae bacterium]|nr:hypothetical protein [Lachnospiraceae bacterium]